MSARVVIDRDPLDLQGAHQLSGKRHEKGERNITKRLSIRSVSVERNHIFAFPRQCLKVKVTNLKCAMSLACRWNGRSHVAKFTQFRTGHKVTLVEFSAILMASLLIVWEDQ